MTAFITLLWLYMGHNGSDLWTLLTSRGSLRACATIFLGFLLAEGYYFVVYSLVGFAIGAAYISMTLEQLPIQKYESRRRAKSTSHNPSMAGHDTLELFYPPLTKVVNQLLRFIFRDFVLNWWSPLNVNNDLEFEMAAQRSLNAAISNIEQVFLKQEKNDIVMTTVYGMANTLIIHLRECQSFESSGLSLDLYISQNLNSPFAQTLPAKEQHEHLCSLSSFILKRILPQVDSSSPLVILLLKGLLATHLFGAILDSCSDPDFINGWIVDMLKDTPSLENQADFTDGEGGDYDGLRSLVEKATDDIIAESGEAEMSQSPTDLTSDEELSSVSSLNSLKPPSTPRPQARVPTRPANGLDTVNKQKDDIELQPSLIYPPETISFDIMDISDPAVRKSSTTPGTKNIIYSIQIERPAMQDKPGSEGGGYVISRSYLDFDTFQAMLLARHNERIQQLRLCLPFELGDKDICMNLQSYLRTVVQDERLGRDTLVARFLRKESRINTHGNADMPFADEYAGNSIVKAYFEDVNKCRTDKGGMNRAMSFLSRSPSLQSKGNAPINTTMRWLNRKVGRDNSVAGQGGQIKNRARSDNLTEKAVNDNLNTNNQTAGGTRTLKRQKTIKHKPLAALDIELLIETTFALVVEIFNLTVSNNKAWVRRSLLSILREIVRRSYTEIIAEQYDDYINTYLAPDALVGLVEQILERFWPNGEWQGEVPSRSQKEIDDTKNLAREMLMNKAIPSSLRQLIGDQNCNTAMEQLWVRFQNKSLNRILFLQLLERVVQPIFG